MLRKTGSFLLDLCSKDVPRSLRFYRDILGGALFMYDEPREGWDGFFMIQVGPATIMVGNYSASLEGEHAIPSNRIPYLQTHKWGMGITPFFKDVVDDIDIFYQYLQEKQVSISQSIHTTSYGWRMFGITDPDGYMIVFANEIDKS